MRITVLLFVALICLTSTDLCAQSGKYSETDMEYQSLFIDAELAKHQGKTEVQIKALKEVLKRNKSEHAAHFQLARAFFSQENYEQAEKHILSAIKFNNNNEWYVLTAAEIYESSLQYGKAAVQYKQLTLISPKNPVSYHKLSINLLKNGNVKEAIVALETLQDKTGIDEETSKRLFDIYRKTGKNNKALSVLQDLSDSSPSNTRYLNNLAGFLTDLGKDSEAQKIFHRVLELDPNNAQASLALVKKSTLESEAGDYLSSLIPVMENQNIPLDNKIRELMPFISSMSKTGSTTIALLQISENLVNSYPSEAKVFAVRGDVLFYSANYLEAERAYEKSISLNDRQFVLWDQWMLNLWELENYKKLEQISFDAIDLFPNEVDAYILRSLCLFKLKDFDQSKDFAKEANFIAANSQRFQSPLQIVNLWLDQDKLDSSALQSALSKIDPSKFNRSIYFELIGDLYKTLGENDRAKILWDKAVERGANNQRIDKKSGV